MIDLLLNWFVTNPLDVLFTFGMFAYFISSLTSSLDKRTQIPRLTSAAYGILTACFIVGNYKLGLYVASFVNIFSLLNWVFLFTFRPTRPLPVNDSTS